MIYIPDNGRDTLAAAGGMPNGQHRTPESESPEEIASVELPPLDDVISPNGDHHGDDDLEHDLGLR